MLHHPDAPLLPSRRWRDALVLVVAIPVAWLLASWLSGDRARADLLPLPGPVDEVVDGVTGGDEARSTSSACWVTS